MGVHNNLKNEYNDIIDKVLLFLRNNPRYSYNAPSIHKYFKGRYKIGTIRSSLTRLHEKKMIHRETHGYYRIRLDGQSLFYLENPPTLLHGIIIQMRWNRKLQKGIDVITFDNDILDDVFDRLTTNGFKQTSGRNKKRLVKSFYYNDDYDRKITLTVHFNGKLDVFINCSNHPVNCLEFRDILSFTQGTISYLGPFSEQNIVSFDQAKDFKTIRMEGCSCLTLRAYMDSWFKVYNKESLGVLRVENKVHPSTEVPVSYFIDLFERMFLPRNGNGHREFQDDEGMYI